MTTSAPGPPEGSPPRAARILIAEDDLGMRELITELVRELGHEPVAVPDGTAALAALAVQPPDLILSDLGMPGQGGFELCRRVKADPATRHIPVILMTGIGSEHRSAALQAGADDFLGKPFTLRDLQVRIHAFLHRGSTRLDNGRG